MEALPLSALEGGGGELLGVMAAPVMPAEMGKGKEVVADLAEHPGAVVGLPEKKGGGSPGNSGGGVGRRRWVRPGSKAWSCAMHIMLEIFV